MPNARLVIACCLLLTTHPLSAELENATLDSGLTYGYGNDASTSMQALLELSPEVEFSISGNTSLIASARVRLDAQDELEPGRPTLDTFAPASRPVAIGNTGTAEVRDFDF